MMSQRTVGPWAQRQFDRESGTLSNFTLNLDLTTAFGHDLFTGSKTQPRALDLGGKERAEYATQVFGGNSWTIV